MFLDEEDLEILKNDPDKILKSEKFRLHYKERLPNEFILKDGKKFVSDMPFDTVEGAIINFEIQSYPINYNKETIFNMYQSALHNEHQKQVYTVVFSLVHNKHEIIRHKINQFDGFTMLIISLKALNQKQTINKSNYKIKNNIPLSDKEKALFLLSPIMNKIYKIETLKETIHLTRLNKTMNPEEIIDMLEIQMNFAHEWFNERDFEEIGGLKMGDLLTEDARKHIERIILKQTKEEGRKEGKIEGKIEGIEEGIEKIAINMLKEGFNLEDTSRATGLTKSQINQIYTSK